MKITNELAWGVTFLVLAIGCASTGRVQTTPSPGVDRIPGTIGVYPLLSGTEVEGDRWGAIKPMTNEAREEIYLAPPADSKLAVTPSSQMLTSELSVQMTRYGFDLREMPYELKKSNGSDVADSYVISLGLLDELRDQHGLDAVIVGNAFFVHDKRYSQPTETRVVAAYLKVIDTETLEVLCQVAMSYDVYGRELNDLAKNMASHLAQMAGLRDKS